MYACALWLSHKALFCTLATSAYRNFSHPVCSSSTRTVVQQNPHVPLNWKHTSVGVCMVVPEKRSLFCYFWSMFGAELRAVQTGATGFDKCLLISANQSFCWGTWCCNMPEIAADAPSLTIKCGNLNLVELLILCYSVPCYTESCPCCLAPGLGLASVHNTFSSERKREMPASHLPINVQNLQVTGTCIM